jgi:ribosomal protein S18 acetylase RimI-like enzyme
MIRPFSLSDLDPILQIESQSFPKSPYDWTTFLNLHCLYPETFLVYVNPLTPQPEASGSPLARTARLGSPKSHADELGADPQRRLPPCPEGRGTDAIERVNTDHGQKEEEIWGYIIFAQEGHMISIAVHPDHRRKGIGRKLLQRAMKTPHLKRLWAEVRRSNQGAQAFYAKMGFQMKGMVLNYYGNEDALIIQWTPD